uniref:Uncharacterized protein n=1 Tax=Panagrolaimus superbus TaxID=310955 RepID=A0A914Z9I3_9BILA
MLKLDPQSKEKVPLAIDFFSSKPTLLAFQHSSTCEYLPITPLPGSPIHFRINSGETYIDMTKLKLVTSFRITRKEGDRYVKIDRTDPISFIQGFGGTYIRNLKVAFNGRAVYNSNDLYAYNAYMRRRLCIGGKQNVQELQSMGYFEDDLSQISGSGFEARRALFENEIQLMNIEITPHNNFFALIGTGPKEYKYDLVDCRLYAKQHLLLPQLNCSIQEQLNKNFIAKYNFKRVIMKNYFIGTGRYDFHQTIFTDYLPKRVFIGLVDAKAFNGHIGMSPFSFEPHGLTSCKIVCNGVITPSYPYNLNFEKKMFGRAFDDLISATGCTTNINIDKFVKHSCFYAFDLQQEQSGEFIELQQLGSTGITLNFTTPVPVNGLQLIIYAEFNSILTLDKTRTIATAMAL